LFHTWSFLALDLWKSLYTAELAPVCCLGDFLQSDEYFHIAASGES
jgi:hypothetical protein